MTAPELKPCPFCGLPDASDVYVRDGRMIICTSCGASGGAAYHGPSGYGSTSEKAAIKWNRRTAAIPDPLDDPCVVALVEALLEYKKRASRIPFNVAIKADAALAAFTKEPPHER